MKWQAIIFSVLFLSMQALWAQVNVKTDIREVTVYLQSAQVTRTGKANLPAGRGTVVLSGLSPQVDHSSLRLGATGDFVILTVNPRHNFLAPATESAEYAALVKESERLTNQITRVKIKMDALEEEEKVMMANKAIGGSQSGVSVDRIAENGSIRTCPLGGNQGGEIGIERKHTRRRRKAGTSSSATQPNAARAAAKRYGGRGTIPSRENDSCRVSSDLFGKWG
ncbi:MAG: DUF4140 domain-containing protein [Saprospiraceae bacterium]